MVLHGAEIDTVGQGKVGVVEQRRFAPTGFWRQSVEPSRQTINNIFGL